MAMPLRTARIGHGRPSPAWHAASCHRRRHLSMQRGTTSAQFSLRGWVTSRRLPAAADRHVALAQAASADGAQYLEGLSGKSFHCTACGKCCTLAADAEVWVSEPESDAIAQLLGISTAAFHATYCKAYAGVPGWRMLQSKPGAITADPDGVSQVVGEVCTFMDVATNKCTIHGTQPIQCATFPWWPELQAPAVWQAEKAAVCEGLDHAEAAVTDVAEAMAQLQLAEAHERRFEEAVPADWDPCLELYPNRPKLW